MSNIFDSESMHVVALGRVTSRLEEVEKRSRALEAERIALLAEAFDIAAAESDRSYSSTPKGKAAELAYRSVRAELATALRLSEATIDRKLGHAFSLTANFPQTFAALQEGHISTQHTNVIVDAATVIGAGKDLDTISRRFAFETEALEVAHHESPNRLRPIARRLAEQYAATSLDERHDEACAERRVFVLDRDDGMSDLIAHLPSVEAHAIYHRLTQMSREVTRAEAAEAAEVVAAAAAATRPENTSHEADGAAPDELYRRTRDQIRADLLSESLRVPRIEQSTADQSAAARSPHDRPSDMTSFFGLAGVQAQVQILVTDKTLFAPEQRIEHPWITVGATTALAPAELVGSGPIDTSSARTLARAADQWQLIHHHPESGEVLSVERYRPTAEMRRLLGARDLHCRFPGCRAPLHRCDVDHTIDAAKGGRTATDNLANLCRGHHVLKHHGGWNVTQHRSGVLEWRSPTGRSHLDRPPSKVRFTSSNLIETPEPETTDDSSPPSHHVATTTSPRENPHGDALPF